MKFDGSNRIEKNPAKELRGSCGAAASPRRPVWTGRMPVVTIVAGATHQNIEVPDRQHGPQFVDHHGS